MPSRSEFARLAAIVVWLWAMPVAAEPIPTGLGERLVTVQGNAITVFTYRPNCKDPSLLVVLHGYSRNAPGYRNYARRLADARCMIVAAPFFDAQRFPTWRYQHGGLARKGRVNELAQWTGPLLRELIEAIEKSEGHKLAYSLLGHSAGAQFLMRVAASVPLEARRIVIANPGSLVWADAKIAVPYGLGGLAGQETGEATLRRYLALPITIYLGEDDTEAKELSQARQARDQGANRLERGVAIYKAAEATAKQLALPFRWRLVALPGTGHSARKMFEAEQALQAIEP